MCHLARTTCRRAERCAIHLGESEEINPVTVQYLNRLSDLLFVAARALNSHAGRSDILWQPERNR